MKIRQREVDTYDAILSLGSYGEFSPGQKYAPVFASLARPGAHEASPLKLTVLDAGCGSGKGMVALSELGYSVMGCDLTPVGLVEQAASFHTWKACLWDESTLPGRGDFDYVYCCDVLEHIPTAFVALVLRNLLRLSRRGLFLSVCLVPDGFGVWVGKPLHQTVLRFDQWRDILGELGRVVDARDLNDNAVFMVVPR